MLTIPIRGAGVALVTPFDHNGNVDYPSLKRVTEFTISKGIDFLVALGTTAETPTLDKDEKLEIVRVILETNNGRKPVVLGIGGNDTHAVVKQIGEQSFTGIDYLLNVAPYYNKPNQTGLYKHFEAIADSSPVPVILYNVPGRTGSNISADTTLRLAHDKKNIIATKEASGNFDQIMAILRDRPKGFAVLSGDDALTLPTLSLGAEGVISVIANACPGRMSKMVGAMKEGKLGAAQKLHYEMLELIQMIFAEGSPAGIKAALRHMNLCDDNVRLPLTPVSEALSIRIRDYLKTNLSGYPL
ncbi:MAG: 4-hydroxy-tetrahydrodipicolinate synthase [Bacteroidia bacterium]|nr:4-hydroxy-tetrahydrodipicolinate synthase [Bacteroidia bacterium]